MRFLSFISRPKAVTSIVLIIVLAVTAVLVFNPTKADSKSSDSGVVACQAISDNSSNLAGDGSNLTPMTEQVRQEKRSGFEKSQHADLRTAGTAFVDAVYRMDQDLEKADLDGVVELTNSLNTSRAALWSACKNHGVTLPEL